MRENYIALIPAYKPMAVLPKLASSLKALGFVVILVDDGSGAEYAECFSACERYGTVLHHNENAGKGRALKTGLSYISEHFPPDAVVVTVDADGQHRPNDALAICGLAEELPDTLILGSRMLDENVPLRSQFGNTVTRFVYRISTGLKVHDTQTGLRAFSMSLIPKLLSIPGERYEYEMNVLLQCARESVPIREHPIETVYIDGNSQSHFNAVKDSFRIYREILKFSASSFIGFLVDYAAYSLLLLLTGRLRMSNIVARVISATVNFTINRKFVFHSKDHVVPAMAKYFLLAAVILVGNTIVLEFLVNTCGIHKMLAKIITELLFFTFSWLVQRLVIFRNKKGEHGK